MKRLTSFIVLPFLFIGCAKNNPPVISDLVTSPDTRHAGTEFTLTVTASDEDKDSLSYQWSAAEGAFTSATNLAEVKWKSPADGAGKNCQIEVAVSDGENNVSREIRLLLVESELGCVKGNIYFTWFNIPVTGAKVAIGNRTAITDENGYFFIADVVSGMNVLSAEKQDYTDYASVIKIVAGDTLEVMGEMMSVTHSTKLSGLVTDQDGQSVENARVVVLNPDGTESKLISVTDVGGNYKLWNIPHGERTLEITKETIENYSFEKSINKFDFQEITMQINLIIQKISVNGSFTDPRDNHVYRKTNIGNTVWMAENAAFLPKVYISDSLSYIDPRYYVYNYQGTQADVATETANYKKYGVLYNFPAAMTACPPGWRLPYRSEYDALIALYTTDAAVKLKSKTGWPAYENGDNGSGFNAIPSGILDTLGLFVGEGAFTRFLTLSEISGRQYYYVLELAPENMVMIGASPTNSGCAVRCIKE